MGNDRPIGHAKILIFCSRRHCRGLDDGNKAARFISTVAQCRHGAGEDQHLFEAGARIGPGKAALLESIRDTGSISAAARDMGMSYKRAWMLLDSINQAFTEPVVTAAPGDREHIPRRPL